MIPDRISNQYLYFAIIILVGVIAILPIVFYGIPNTVDTPQHFKFANIYYHSIQNGEFFLSVSDKENAGYGGIGNRFYPPLEYYFLAFMKMIVGNWYDAAWLNFIFWMILGSFGIYFWSRCWLSPKESTVAACFFVIIPIHLSHLYNSYNTFSEFAAVSLLTFCFGFLTRIFQQGKWTDALGLAFFYALLILTHLPLTLVGSICLAVYALLFWRKTDGIKPLTKCFAAASVGISASSFYWFGMLTEMNWLKHASDRFSRGAFGYEIGFFPFFYHQDVDFSYSSWILDLAVGLTLLFLASSIVYFIYKSRNLSEQPAVAGWSAHHPETSPLPQAVLTGFQKRSVFRTVLPLGLFAFFMVTPFSDFIWKIITPLQKIQFPIRWLPVTAMCGAIVASASIHYLLKGNFLKRRTWIYASITVVTVVFLYNVIYIWHPTAFVPLSREKFDKNVITPPEAESFHFWWAIWSKSEAFEIKEKVLAGNRPTEIVSWEAESRVFEISEGTAENVRVATFYYPHWQATVNDNPVAVGKDENGAILIPVSSEKSVVKLHFQEPVGVQIATYLSIFTWFALFALILFSMIKKSVTPPSWRLS